jgi:hypothetical protein
MDGFKKTTLAVAHETQVSAEVIGDLAYNMRAAGLEFEASDGKVGDAEKTFAHMVGTLGMSVDEVTRFAGRARMMGGSVSELHERVVNLEKDFNIPGLLEGLPSTMDDVIKTQALFGKNVVQDSREMSIAVTKLAGVYSRALGYTATEATKAAREQFVAFAGETSAFDDVFLGLSDSFSPLQTAFLEVGFGIDEVGQLMKKAQSDPMAIADAAERVKREYGEGSRLYQRFHKQLLKGLPEEQRLLQARVEQLREQGLTRAEIIEQLGAERKERKKNEDSQKVFDSMITGMRNNVVDFYQMFQVMLRNLKTEASLDLVQGLKDGFKELTGWVIKLTHGYRDVRAFFSGSNEKAIDKYGKTFKKIAGYARDLFGKNATERAKKFRKVVGTVAAVSVGLATAIATVAAVAGPLIGLLKPAWGLLKGLGKSVLGAGKGAGKFGGSMKILGAIFRKVALPIGIALALFDGFKDRIGKIGNAIKNSDWDTAMSETLGGLYKSVNSFLFGLPEKFMEGFRNVAGDINTTGSEEMGKAFGDLLGRATTAIIDWWAKDAQPAIAKIIGKMASVDFWYDVLKGLAALGHHIIAFVKGMADGFLKRFGLSFKALPILAKIVWIKMQKYAWTGMVAIGNFVWDGIAKMMGYFQDLKAGALIVFEKLKFYSNPLNLKDTAKKKKALDARIKAIHRAADDEILAIKRRRDAGREATEEFLAGFDQQIEKQQEMLNKQAAAAAAHDTEQRNRQLARARFDMRLTRDKEAMAKAAKKHGIDFEGIAHFRAWRKHQTGQKAARAAAQEKSLLARMVTGRKHREALGERPGTKIDLKSIKGIAALASLFPGGAGEMAGEYAPDQREKLAKLQAESNAKVVELAKQVKELGLEGTTKKLTEIYARLAPFFQKYGEWNPKTKSLEIPEDIADRDAYRAVTDLLSAAHPHRQRLKGVGFDPMKIAEQFQLTVQPTAFTRDLVEQALTSWQMALSKKPTGKR